MILRTSFALIHGNLHIYNSNLCMNSRCFCRLEVKLVYILYSYVLARTLAICTTKLRMNTDPENSSVNFHKFYGFLSRFGLITDRATCYIPANPYE